MKIKFIDVNPGCIFIYNDKALIKLNVPGWQKVSINSMDVGGHHMYGLAIDVNHCLIAIHQEEEVEIKV